LQSDIQKIERVQEKALKMIPGLKKTNCVEKGKEVGITIETRRKIQDMTQTFEVVHGLDKVNRVTLFKHVPEGRTRQAADSLNMRSDPARTEIRRNFFMQRIGSK
jgi:ribonucleases P/MRP protein subunit RPP40